MAWQIYSYSCTDRGLQKDGMKMPVKTPYSVLCVMEERPLKGPRKEKLEVEFTRH